MISDDDDDDVHEDDDVIFFTTYLLHSSLPSLGTSLFLFLSVYHCENRTSSLSLSAS